MASGSIVAAVIAKYGTLTAGNFPSSTRPEISLDEALQQDDGTQQRTPYVILRDGGDSYQWDMEVNGESTDRFSLDIYGTLLECDTILAAILWNGQNPNTVSGLAFATLSLTAPLYAKERGVIPTTSQRSYAGLNYLKQRTYKVTQDFEAMYETRGTG